MDTTQTEEVTERHEQPTEEATTAEGGTAATQDAAESVAVAVIDGDPHTKSQGDSEEVAAVPAATSSGVLAASASLVSAGIGLAAITGTWVGTMIANRLELVGQINAQSGKSANPILDVYGTPWHANALVNGVFALVAILVAGVCLLASRATPQWVKAAAVTGLTLGVIGLVIAGAMYFDLFSAMPAMPAQAGG